MPSTKSLLQRRNCPLWAVAALLVLVPFAQGAKVPGPKKPAKVFGAEYAGSETCQTCHEDLYNSVLASPHQVVEKDADQGFTGHACESCHGPGATHAGSASPTDIKNPATLPAIEADKICLNCHLNQTLQSGRIQSSHMKDSVSCVTCHKIHANGPVGLAPRTQEQVNQLCSSCHLSVRAQFEKPFRHKIPENAMTCVDCHNPHGSVRPSMTQTFAANEPACINCHGDKRGPFTFEHAPVRFEGCGSCHEAHGSVNPRMLTRQQVKSVCLECHANLPINTKTTNYAGVVPPAFHNLNSPTYQNCTVCHQKVHGSYVDRNLLK